MPARIFSRLRRQAVEPRDLPRNARVSHVKGIVGAVEELVRAQGLPGELETIGIVNDRVVVESPEVRVRRLGPPALGFFPFVVAVLPAPADPGGETAHVAQQEGQGRKPVQHPAEDQAGNGNGGGRAGCR